VQLHLRVAETWTSNLKTFDAQSVARDAALADAEFASQVGNFVSVEYGDDNRVATYLFEAEISGYKGWRWAITVAKVDEKSEPTICDVPIVIASNQQM
jgi:hypothetical protein